jgi:hypothetical protein
MIEYLGRDYMYTVVTTHANDRTPTEAVEPVNLCDALWEAVKEILEKE